MISITMLNLKQAYVTLENKETKTMHVQADIGKMI